MNWSNIKEIAEQLDQIYPTIEPKTLPLTHLHRMILSLPDFHSEDQTTSRKVLLKIQQEWTQLQE